MDLEEPVEAGDREDLLDLRTDVRETKLTVPGLHLVVDRDQRAKGRGGQVLHVLEADQHPRTRARFHQTTKLASDQLDVRLIEDVALDEVDSRHPILFRDPKAGCCWIHEHGLL